MSYQTENNELRARFNTQWGDRIPVAWPNASFTPPNPISPWCRFSITEGESQRTTFGANTNNVRHTGIIYIQIFTPSNTGDGVALQRADEAAGIFRKWCGTNITCRDASIKVVGSTGDGWYQINVSIPFIRDELF